MKFRDALNKKIEPLLEFVLSVKFDKDLYRKKEKLTEDLQSYSNQFLIPPPSDYGLLIEIQSVEAKRDELKKVGTFEFLRKHPEYQKKASSLTSSFINKLAHYMGDKQTMSTEMRGNSTIHMLYKSSDCSDPHTFRNS